MPVLHDITHAIGRSPLIKLHRLGAGLPATIALTHYRRLIAYGGDL
jgi:hypothetical protein